MGDMSLARKQARGRPRRLMAGLMAALLAWGLLAVGLAAPAGRAEADEGVITGSCYIEMTEKSINMGGATPHGLWNITMPDGQVIQGECVDPGLFCPVDGWYDFEAVPKGGGFEVTVQSAYYATSIDRVHPWEKPFYRGPGNTQRIGHAMWYPNGQIELSKSSANPAVTQGNACYDFAGIVYGVYSDAACSVKVAEIELDSAGNGTSPEIRYGTYYVKELRANGSYALSDEVHEVEVASGATVAVSAADEPLNDPDGLIVRKYDAGTGAFVPTGDTKLALAEYTFEYIDGYAQSSQQFEQMKGSAATKRTWVMRTNANGYTDLRYGNSSFEFNGKSYPYKVSGDSFFVDDNGDPIVPLGTVRIRETKAPEGYNLSDRTYLVRIVADPANPGHTKFEGDSSLVQDGNTATEATKAEEQPARGGVTIHKRDAETGSSRPMAPADWEGVAFEIVNRSSGDVTYAGVRVPVGGVVTVIRPSAADGAATTGNNALQYGTYGIREVATSDGYLMSDTAERTFEIRRDGQMVVIDGADAVRNQVKRGDFELVKIGEDKAERLGGVPFLVTSKATGEAHVVVTDANGQVKTASEWNAHTQKTNANDAAVDANGDGVFSEEEKGSVDVSKLDCYAGLWFGLHPETGEGTNPNDALGALPWGDYTIEELRVPANKRYELITADIQVRRHGVSVEVGTLTDTRPDLKVPWIGTSARDGADGDRVLSADPEATVIDRVEYANLDAGELYRAVGTLMDKATGEPVRDTAGCPVAVERTFVAEDVRGFVELVFTFDATALAGDVVVFESVYREGTDELVAKHEDIDDYYQTVGVYRPLIGTSLSDADDGDKEIVAGPTVTLVDTIAYKDLVPGREYTAVGTLMVAGDEPAPLMRPVTDASGAPVLGEDGQPLTEPVTAEVSFVPDAATGTVEVAFEFPGSAVEPGASLVAYEKLYRVGVEVAAHEDPDDPAQTVTVVAPEIGTMATDASDGDKEIEAAAGVTVVDTVAYENLVPGLEYALSLTVMRKTGEGTAEPLLGKDGAPVAATATFTPEASSGSVDVMVELDATELAGAELVMYERLSLRGEPQAAHEDPDDEGQTVRVAEPALATTAVDASDGDHTLLPGKKASITDTVSYAGLIPGKEYVIKGTLMDKATGEPVRDAAGRPVTAERRFTPNAAHGSVDVSFAFDASSLGGTTVVVFEELVKDGVLVAAHADIDDAAQTVEIAEPLAKTGGFFAKTGVDLAPLTLAALLLGAAACGLALAARRARGSSADAADSGAQE